MRFIFILAVITALSTKQITAFCMRSAPDHRNPGICNDTGVIYHPGDKWETNECVECTCSDDGAIGCCGVGFRAGVMSFGPGCKIIEFDCYEGELANVSETEQCSMAGMKISLRRNNNNENRRNY